MGASGDHVAVIRGALTAVIAIDRSAAADAQCAGIVRGACIVIVACHAVFGRGPGDAAAVRLAEATGAIRRAIAGKRAYAVDQAMARCHLVRAVTFPIAQVVSAFSPVIALVALATAALTVREDALAPRAWVQIVARRTHCGGHLLLDDIVRLARKVGFIPDLDLTSQREILARQVDCNVKSESLPRGAARRCQEVAQE